jgi:RNA polymerase sigma factor (sigma-70 family)
MTAAGQIPDLMGSDRKQDVSRIVREAGQRLMRFIRARVPSEADAEDILQDVWRQLIFALEDGPVEHVSAWLYTVARNRIIDRSRKPRLASLDEAETEAAAGAAFELPGFFFRDDPSPEVEDLRRLFWDELRLALAELPEEQRQVFVWHELDGLSFQRIAELTGENVNTLLSRKRYAVLHLRRRFESLRNEFFP